MITGISRIPPIEAGHQSVAHGQEGLDLGGSVVPGAFPHGHFNGVAVSPDGSIVVPADGSSSVIRLRAPTE